MRFLFFLLFLTSFHTFSQSYQLLDEQSREAIPFGKVIPSKENPRLTDIDGIFQLQDTLQNIQVRATGYFDTIVQLSLVENGKIYLKSKAQNVQEVVVKPGVNPAERIMAQVIANRMKNHPFENDGFISKQYSKFTFDLDDASRKILEDTVVDPSDTNIYSMKQFFGRQHLFLIETASQHYFEPPYKEKEIVEAYKVSGFTDPMFSTFAQSMQSFHFYDNQVELLSEQFVNPIAFGGIKRYLFILEDTTINGADTTFTIFFRPRKGKDFEGLTGRLFINTNGFAIEKVVAKPYRSSSGGTEITIIQEYAFLNGKKWFPVKLSTEVQMVFAAINVSKGKTAFVTGKGATYMEKIQFNPPELEKVKFNNIAVQTKVGSEKINDATWDSLRPFVLTDKEKTTYVSNDSLSKEEHLDRYLKMAKVLSSGRIPLGYVNLDVSRLFSVNGFEKTRLGLGFENSDKVIPWMTASIYGAYGFGDKVWKYGGALDFHLDPSTKTNLKLFYSNDVVEVGGNVLYKTSLFYAQDPGRMLFVNNMSYQKKAGIQFSTIIRANKHLTLELNYQQNQFTNGYQFMQQASCSAFMSSLLFSWAIREKGVILGDVFLPKGSKFPKIQIKVEKAWNMPSLDVASMDFLRLQFNAFHVTTIPGNGRLTWNVRAAWTNVPTPLLYQQAVHASYVKRSISIPNTFETVAVSEFYHQQQVNVFLRYIWNAQRTKAKWNEPQFGIHYAFGYGTMSNQSAHNLSFQTMDKGFHEAGLLFNGLYVSGQSSIGFGIFTRFGAYANTGNWKSNVYPKLSFGYVF
ncbi:MAG: hypothetical protein RL207_1630 [Bacteroidota bacterium]|jgi:hypothetical protein